MTDTYRRKHETVLELNKILAKLSDYAGLYDSKEQIMNIEPDYDLKRAQKNLSETEEAYILVSRFGAPSFSGIKNIDSALTKANAGGVLSLGELLKIGEVLRLIRSLKEWREHFGILGEGSIDRLFEMLCPNKYFEDKIFMSIVSDEEMSDSASDALYNIRRKIKSASQSIREKLEKMIKSTTYQKYLQEQIVTQRDGRFVVPVKSEHRSAVPGLVHDTSSSGATLFIEPMAIVEVNNELKVLFSKEKEEIERILREFSGEVAQFSESISFSYNAVVKLDIIFAKAKLGFDMRAVVPKLNDSGRVLLKNARHPLLHKDAVVPISVSLGIDFDTLIITGPNTGGKTVTLKTIGLLSLMAMCGMLIPADEGSDICIFENIFADIGDEQSIEQSLSTFSSHIKNIVSILKNVNSRSLCLLDELGAGTDPIEGAALAKSILMKLRDLGAKTVSTTHYAELKSYAIETEGVENASSEFNVSTLKPTYRLLIGVPGRSNAFAISEKLGIEKEIIDTAENLVNEENRNFEKIVSSLETSRQSAEEKLREAEATRAKLKKTLDKAKTSEIEFEEQRKKVLDKARADAKRIVESARYESERLLGELEDMRKKFNKENSSEIIKNARLSAKSAINNMEKNADPIENRSDDSYKLPRPLKVGDTVIIADINKQATVMSLPDKDGKVRVLAGIINTTVEMSNLRLCDSIKQKEKIKGGTRKISGMPSKIERSATLELDLRGFASDEAVMELDRFIDEAIISGAGAVTIIHGKGTGVLRKAVQQHLKNHPSVRTYRLGVFGEGEMGVTIAELK